MTALQSATLEVARKKRRDVESKEQCALIEWAQYAALPAAPDIDLGAKVADYLFAIPNGGKRSITEAERMKREGVKAGVHDLMLPLPRGGKHGLWVEMKRADGVASKPQLDWKRRMVQAGYEAHVCRGFDEAREVICRYLGMTAPAVVPRRPAMVRAEQAVRSFLKSKPVKSEAYLRLVAKRPCIHCGIVGYSQAAHENHGKAAGKKLMDDRKTMPLCMARAKDCHGKFDRYELFSSRAEHIAMGMKWSRETRHGIRADGLWPEKIEFMD
jgi:hypothetical protein